MAVTIAPSFAVQHHPARPDLELRVARRIRRAGFSCEVVVDPDPFGPPNPWRCAREAWRRTPDNCTHRVVVQDDALLCTGFAGAVTRALAAQPTGVVTFFVSWIAHGMGRAVVEACERCASWALLPQTGWYPHVAVALPRDDARSLAGFHVNDRQIADDLVLANWAHANRREVWATVPSLVDHDDSQVSTIAGHVVKDSRRGAACFIGDHHPRLVDWNAR